MPKASILMPAFNGAAHIGSAIRSVVAQTWHDWQLIIVDDGSIDATATVVSNFSSDPRIHYIQQERRGQAAARNAGLRYATGDWVAFLDQDDLWLPQKLERELVVTEQQRCDVIFSDGYIFADDEVEDTRTSFKTLAGLFGPEQMFQLLFEHNRIPVLSALVRASALGNAGPLYEGNELQNCDDYDLWMRLAANGATFFGIPECLVRYRIHSSQASSDLIKQRRAELATLRQHENHPWLDSNIRRKRLHEVYESLVTELAKRQRYDEALVAIRQMRRYQRFPVKGSLQAAIMRLCPERYVFLNHHLHRLEHSIVAPARLGRGDD